MVNCQVLGIHLQWFSDCWCMLAQEYIRSLRADVFKTSSLVPTLNMLICLNDYKRSIHNLSSVPKKADKRNLSLSIHNLNRILGLAWPKWKKLTLEQQYMLSVLHGQYHACWCSGDLRSQCISKHGNDPQSWSSPSPTTEELISARPCCYCCIFVNIVCNGILILTINKSGIIRPTVKPPI